MTRTAAARVVGSERGAALVLALLVVALLMTLVLEFDRSVRLEHRAAANYRDGTAAFYLARAGAGVGQWLVEEDGRTSPNLDALDEPWALGGGDVPVGDRGSVRVTIVDEERFFPVNAAADFEWTDDLERLLRALEIDERLADAIADWIDLDDNIRAGGAESSYYESLPAPYRARNGPIASLDELRFVRGMTDERFRLLAPHLTAASSSTVNLNTAGPVVLEALSPEMTSDIAQRIIDARPIEKKSQLSEIIGNNGPLLLDLNEHGGLTSRAFTIEAEGLVNGSSKVLTIRIERLGASSRLIWSRMPS